MRTTRDFLRELSLRYPMDDGRPATDYRLAKLLSITTTAISRYQNHGGTFGDDIALRVAELLGEKPLHVLACMNAERARNEAVKKVWQSAAAVAVVAVALLGADQAVQLVEYASAAAPSLYIMSNAAAAALAALALVRVFLTVKSPSRA
jgi:hypothetical protein